MGRIAETFLEHIKTAFVLLIAGSAAAAVYLLTAGLRIDYNVESFLPESNPVIREYRSFAEQFPRDDAFMVVAFESDSLFSGHVLADIDEMTRAFEKIPTVDEVLSVTNHQQARVTSEEIRLEPVITHFGADKQLLEKQKRDILTDSTAVGHLVNRPGNVAAFYVHMGIDGADYSERAVVIEGVEDVTGRFSDRYDFKFSGIPYIRNVYVDSIESEMRRYVVLSTLVILIALFWLFRSVRGVAVPVVIVYLGMLWTITMMMITGGSLDVLSSTIAAIILVVGVADSVHLVSRYNDSLLRGMTNLEAVRDMIVRLGSATFLTSVTTAVGFATLTTSPIVPMRRFGLFAAIGVLITFFVSIVILTAALVWLNPTRSPSRGRSGSFSGFLTRVDAFCSRRWRSILWVCLIIAILSGISAGRLRVNSYVNDDLGPRTRAFQDMVFIQDRLVSPFPLEVLIDAGRADAFHDPDYLRRVRRIQRHLDSETAVGRTISVVDLLDKMNRELNPDPSADGIPDDRELAAQYLFLLEMIDPDLVREYVSADHSRIRLSALVDDVGSARLNPLLVRLDSALNVVLPPEVKVIRTGTVVLVSTVSGLITDSMLLSIGLAFVFVSLIMALIFRRPIMLLISLVPNVFPLIVTAGFMGLAGIDIKPATAVIFSISFGIAVDDTIHFLARLRQELNMGRPMPDAVRFSLIGTGKAIILTSIILIVGFAVLSTSQFQSSTYMGGLISLTILAALLADLILLPALLHAWTHFSKVPTREEWGKSRFF